MSCFIDTAAAGDFKAITVATNVPGDNGKSNAANQDFVRDPPRWTTGLKSASLTPIHQPLVVNIDAGTACTGALGAVNSVCLVKCQNPAGPFGGVVPIQIAGGGGGGGGKANNKAGKKDQRSLKGRWFGITI